MRFFGLEISRAKAAIPTTAQLSAVSGNGGWWPLVQESFSGAWQRNVTLSTESVLAYFAVYACVTLIAGDIAKMRLRLVRKDGDGIWNEVEANSPFWPVLRRPNSYQNRIAFITWWMVSKLIHGNTYVLKVRDNRGVVTGLYILDPVRTKPMVSPNGSVFYALSADNLSGVTEAVMVPAREIIHDVNCPLFHPLVGVSPLFASGLAAMQGLRIMNNSERFFANGSNPGGVLTAPGSISDETAERMKARWETNYGGENIGKVAVLGDGLKYEPMFVNAQNSQLIEQLKMTGEQVCSTFHVPPYKVGIGPPPAYNNIEALNQEYYQQALQNPIESIELLLDEGMELPQAADNTLGTEFDLDDLLRMDSATLIDSNVKGLSGGLFKPNEARKRMNLPPVDGGDSPMMQQQQFSLAALAERDRNKPFATPTPAPSSAESPSAEAKGFESVPLELVAANEAYGLGLHQ